MRGSAVGTVPWVGFRIGEVPLAVEARSVRGVAWNSDLLRVPFTPAAVAGVMVRAGRVVPVFDLGRVPSAWNRMPRPGGGQVVILGEGEMEAGILADGAGTFHAAPPSAAGSGLTAPAAVREDMLSGAVRSGDLVYGVLSVPAALHAAGVPETFSG